MPRYFEHVGNRRRQVLDLLAFQRFCFGNGDNRFAVGEVSGFQVSQNFDLGVIGNSSAVGYQYATQRVDQRMAHQPLPFGILAVEHLVTG